MDVASYIIDKYVDLFTTFTDSRSSCTSPDSGFAYSREVLTLGIAISWI